MGRDGRRRFVRGVVAAGALLVATWAGGAAPAGGLNDSLYSRQWGLAKIGAPAAWDAGLRGAGVDIAILDTGLHLQHQEFTGRIRATRNFVRPGASAQDDNCEDTAPDPDPTACGNGGHGTHVTGIAAAGIDQGGTVGVAPEAGVLVGKVLSASGSGSFSAAAAAIRWAVDSGAEVINLSFGGRAQGLSGAPEELVPAVREAWSRGVICVFAAGNSFVLPSGFADEPALVVSATNRQDEKPDFSSGVGIAKWGIAAPGGGDTVQFEDDENIWSTAWTSDTRTDTYTEKRGTSMSAPFVAGAAAVLRGAGLTPQQTVDRLLATAKDLGPPGPDSTFGAGRLDLAKAVQGLSAATAGSPAASPPAPVATNPPPATASGSGSAPSRSTRSARPAAGGAGTSVPSTTPPPVEVAAPAAEGVVDTTTAPVLTELEAVEDAEEARAPVPRPPSGDDGPRTGWVVVAAILAVAVAGGTAWLIRTR